MSSDLIFWQGARPRPPSPVGLLLISLFALTACRTAVPRAPVNLSEETWTVRQGQAVWRPNKGLPEIAGELLLARSSDGRSFVQFIKTPFPILTGQTSRSSWQIEFPPQHRTFSGRGKPPARLIWLHLAACLFEDSPPPKHWILERGSDQPKPQRSIDAQAKPATGDREPITWRFENRATGETLEGFLNP